METIHSDFNICGKVARLTTDNGSNFLKAARGFGSHDGAAFDEKHCDDEYEVTEFIELDSILSQMPLPRGVLPITLLLIQNVHANYSTWF